jgi:hypothetical protein
MRAGRTRTTPASERVDHYSFMIGGFRMNLCRTGECALSEVLDVDLSAEERQRLARIDALLRAVAACDRHRATAPDGVDPRSVRSSAKW